MRIGGAIRFRMKRPIRRVLRAAIGSAKGAAERGDPWLVVLAM